MSLGGWITALILLLAMCSLGNEPFLVGGFIGTVLIIFGFSCGIRLMLLATKEKELGVEWKSFKWYSIGAAISAFVPLGLFLLAV